MAGFVRSARVAAAGCLLPAVLTSCAATPGALPVAAVTSDATPPALHSVHVVNHGWHTGLELRAGHVPAAAWPVKADFPEATYFGDDATCVVEFVAVEQVLEQAFQSAG